MSRRCLGLVKSMSSLSRAKAQNLPYGYHDPRAYDNFELGPEARTNLPVMSMVARYMLPENTAHVSLFANNTLSSILTSSVFQTTFLYQKVSPDWIPKGYSNEPVDLEKVIDHNLDKHYGSIFNDAKPVLVKIKEGMVAWHVLEAKGKYYMRHGRLGYLHHVEGPASWVALGEEDRLEGLRTEMVYRKDGTLFGWKDSGAGDDVKEKWEV